MTDRNHLSVLMTTDAVGGVWTHALSLSRELSARGAMVTLASMGPEPDPGMRAEANAVPGLRLLCNPVRLEWMDDPWSDVKRAGEWLLEVERSCRPDVIHLNGYCHGSLPWNAPVLMVGHSCVLSWWEAALREQAPARYERYASEVSKGIHAADVLVAPTRAMLDSLARHYGPHRRARVIPNGTEEAPVPAVPKEGLVLCAARLWDEAKNAHALARVADSLPWPVYLAGDALHPMTGRPVALPAVTLLGRLERAQVLHWYARAAIYCLPARYEPFGLSVLEAARAGCALVLGDIPSLRETWDGAAIFVPPDDREALGAVLRNVMADAAARTRLSELARARAAPLGARAMARRFYQEYLGLAPSPGERADVARSIVSPRTSA